MRRNLCLLLLSVLAVRSSAQEKINFSRDIAPILSENCFACHGPDEKARKAKLRLDTFEGATKKKDDQAAIVPRNVDASHAIRRMLTSDPDDLMPPPDSGKKLTARQIELFKKWIAQGADYAVHWSFAPIREPALSRKTTNPIDAFIVERLQKENLSLSSPASKETLIRRVTFDLTGLPPTLKEVDDFLADQSPNAYEKVVDRLLASPRYGERMALEWLDAARYADTHGYHIDSGRDMTRWREWVIDAFNTNKPFDQFTIEQLAGDLLPNASVDQKVASGFNRNHMINFEGGAIPEEYHTAYIVDRVNTTGAVWLGLAVSCAQCHDHKYDPITQKEYYQLYAFFNNVPENGLDGRKGNAVPMLKTPSRAEKEELARIAAEARAIEKSLEVAHAEADAAQAQWEAGALNGAVTTWSTQPITKAQSKGNASLAILDDKSVRASGANPLTETYTLSLESVPAGTTALRLETLGDDALPVRGPGRSANGNLVLTELKVLVADKPVKLKKASADFAQQDFPASYAIDGSAATGWAVYPEVGKDHQLVVELDQPLASAASVKLVVECNSKFSNHQPGRMRVSSTNSANPHGAKSLPDEVVKALAKAAPQRGEAELATLRRYYRSAVSPLFKPQQAQLAELRKREKEIEAGMRTTMVMEEMPNLRPTRVLMRGQYDKFGETVTANTPAALPPLQPRNPNARPDRLDLARWIVSPQNPLTARVTVNRYWQMYFGTGLVKTAEDLGSQGEFPTHPELLDFLSSRFIKSGWDVKALQRLIVTSDTYRQSSVVTRDLVAKDPENRLLARGPRFRLCAEFIRDQALAVSGLLNGEIGGQSVSPYQPAGLWEELMSRSDGANWSAQTYVQSHGKDLYRRTMYTFWKRTSPPPTLSTFDAPDREVCTVRRPRTNTPLQALVLLNDPTYIEASRKLAERTIAEGGATVEDKIAFAFRLATSRQPSASEIDILRRAYTRHLAEYRANPQRAEQLLKIGEAPALPGLEKAEVAAWALVSSIILNLDEVVTKN